jgi:hypothetical protein
MLPTSAAETSDALHRRRNTMLARRLTTLALIALGVSSSATAQSKQSSAAFHDAMRQLWSDHVTWTRLFIVSAAGNLPDKQAATDRLLQNQTDIGAAVGTIYGKPAGDKLTGLLKDHILIAADLVGAAKAGQSARVDSLNRKWQGIGESEELADGHVEVGHADAPGSDADGSNASAQGRLRRERQGF